MCWPWRSRRLLCSVRFLGCGVVGPLRFKLPAHVAVPLAAVTGAAWRADGVSRSWGSAVLGSTSIGAGGPGWLWLALDGCTAVAMGTDAGDVGEGVAADGRVEAAKKRSKVQVFARELSQAARRCLIRSSACGGSRSLWASATSAR